MKPADQINYVGYLLPTVMQELNAVLTEQLETDDVKILLTVSVANVHQYLSNTSREALIGQIAGLFSGAQVDVTDLLPGEPVTGDTQPFEYLLTSMEHEAAYSKPPSATYLTKRRELIAYIGLLVAQSKRK